MSIYQIEQNKNLQTNNILFITLHFVPPVNPTKVLFSKIKVTTESAKREEGCLKARVHII